MLKSLHLENFTVFTDATFEFSSGINVLIGENGTGKSHVLKAAYLMIASRYSIQVDSGAIKESNSEKYESYTASRLQRIFKTKNTDSIVSFGKKELKITATFSDNSSLSYHSFPIGQSGYSMGLHGGNEKIDEIYEAVFIPPKEFLSTYPNFFSLYEKFRIGFDETYFNLSKLLNQPLLRKVGDLQSLVESLENIIGGKIILKGDHFYLRIFEENQERDIEIDMIAEGIRKIGMLAYLISNDAIKKGVTIFWDEPEANLNPRLMRKLAEALIELTKHNIQIILATHSFFFMKELSLLAEKEQLSTKFFNLIKEESGEITVNYDESLGVLDHIISVDEEILQYDRTLENF
jgi:AAA15 family ATPase/GTPase